MGRRRLPAIEVDHYERDGYVVANIGAGNDGTTRVVPPAGEAYAWDRQEWRRRVSISVSPTGRSVRVWVDGVEVPPRHG